MNHVPTEDVRKKKIMDGFQDILTLKCLLLIPSNTQKYVVDAINNTLLKCKIEVLTLQDISSNTEYRGSILRAIERADFIIADLTGSNPNIMYELGFAHALRKPVILMVKQGDSNVPADLSGYIYFVYDESNVSQLSRNILNWLNHYLFKWSKRDDQ